MKNAWIKGVRFREVTMLISMEMLQIYWRPRLYGPSLIGLMADLDVLKTRSVEPMRYQLIWRVLPTWFLH